MALTAFALILGGTIVGALVRSRLPEHHLTGDSKEVIRLATALVATLTALVLALLFAATRASFEHTSASVSRLATDISELDDVLEEYGPEGTAIRKQLRNEMGPLIDTMWRDDAIAAGRAVPGRPKHNSGALSMLRDLLPRTPAQASLHARALQISTDIQQTRLGLFAQPPELGLHALHGRACPVDGVSLHHLQHVGQAQPDIGHRALRLHPVGLRGDLPHPGARPAVRRVDAGVQRQPARGPDTALRIARVNVHDPGQI